MAVIRVQKTQNYTVMSNHHLRNMNLSLKAKGLVSLMLSLPPSWDYSVAGLVSICKESHTSVRSALKELEDEKYLVRKRTNSEKGYFVYEYTLYEVPEPHTENVHTVNGDADNGHTENHTQLNKEELSTEKINTKVSNNKIYIEDCLQVLKDVKDKELQELYLDYIQMRKSIDAPITIRGLVMLMNRCERLSNMDTELQKALLEAAIINQWKNVYLPNEQDVQNNNTLAQLKRFYGK